MNLLQKCYGHIAFGAVATSSSMEIPPTRKPSPHPLTNAVCRQTPSLLISEWKTVWSGFLYFPYPEWTLSVSEPFFFFLSWDSLHFLCSFSQSGCRVFSSPVFILDVVENSAFVWHPSHSLAEASGALLRIWSCVLRGAKPAFQPQRLKYWLGDNAFYYGGRWTDAVGGFVEVVMFRRENISVRTL